MADESQQGSFWSSLPGILTGAAALITAISGLAIWQHNSTPKPTPTPAPIVQQQGDGQPGGTGVRTGGGGSDAAPLPVATNPAAPPAVPIGSQQWCEEKYTAWKNDNTQSGVDDAGLRKEIVQAHCNQFGIKLGRVKE